MDPPGVDRARRGQDQGGPKKLVARAEWDFCGDAELAASTQRLAEVARQFRERGMNVTSVAFEDVPVEQGPPLLEENEIAWDLFESCQSQVSLGGLGVVVGVSHQTLEWKMRIRGVTDPGEQLELEEKFRVIEAVFVRSCNAKLKSK